MLRWQDMIWHGSPVWCRSAILYLSGMDTACGTELASSWNALGIGGHPNFMA